jgi:hypothetical protein
MIALVKILSTEVDSMMRRVVKVLRFGKSDTQTPFETGPFGYDSNCPKDFIAVYAPSSMKGEPVIIGYINKNQMAEIGETRLYSTNTAGDTEKFYIWLRNTGEVEIGGDTNFAVKFNELKTEFNKLKTNFNNHLTEYNAHLHSGGILTGGLTGVPSAPSAQTNSSNIDNAKNDKIKTIG